MFGPGILHVWRCRDLMYVGLYRCSYDFFLQSPLLGATQYETEFDWGGTHIWVSTCVVQGLRCFFIEPANGFFAVNSVYGRNDDAMRFDFFNKARSLCTRLTAPFRSAAMDHQGTDDTIVW